MNSLYLASVWLHIVAAMAWVGGMIFLVSSVIPLKKPELTIAAARRFRVVGWIALVVLVLTGVFNVLHRGYRFEHFFTGDVFAGGWGRTLALKLACVAFVIVLSLAHDLRAEKGGRFAQISGRITFMVSLAIVALATTLVR
jgi:putative copper resistance protein D